MHPDYDHFIPSTFKKGKFQPQAKIFSGITTFFLLSLTVMWVGRLRFLKKIINFFSLRSCYHKLGKRKSYFATIKILQNFERHDH